MQVIKAASEQEQVQYFQSLNLSGEFRPLPEGFIFLSTGIQPDPVILDYSRHLRETTSPKTQIQYLYELRVFLEFLDSRCESWRSAHEGSLREYREYRTHASEDSTVSQRTWLRCRALIAGFFEFLVVRRYLSVRPYQIIGGNSVLGGRSPNYQTHVRAITQDTWRRFETVGLGRESLEGSATILRDIACAKLMLLAGLRIGEASNLLVPEINAASRDNGQLELEAITKRGRFRVITLTPSILADIRVYRQLERAEIVDRYARSDVDDSSHFIVTECQNGRITGSYKGKKRSYKLPAFPLHLRQIAVEINDEGKAEPLGLFLSSSRAKMISTAAWHKVFRNANARVSKVSSDWKAITPHDLRHTFATVLMAAHIEALENTGLDRQDISLTRRLSLDPVGRVQRALGHSSPNTTAVYLRSPYDLDGDFNKKLDSWAEGGK